MHTEVGGTPVKLQRNKPRGSKLYFFHYFLTVEKCNFSQNHKVYLWHLVFKHSSPSAKGKKSCCCHLGEMQSCWQPECSVHSALRFICAGGARRWFSPDLAQVSGTCSLKMQTHFTPSHLISNKYSCFILDMSRWIWHKTSYFTHTPGGVYVVNRERSWHQQIYYKECILPRLCSGPGWCCLIALFFWEWSSLFEVQQK